METFWAYILILTIIFLWDTFVKVYNRASIKNYDKKLKKLQKLQNNTSLDSQLNYIRTADELKVNSGMNLFGLIITSIFAYYLVFIFLKFSLIVGIKFLSLGNVLYYLSSKSEVVIEWVYMVLFLSLFHFIFNNKIILLTYNLNFITVILLTIVFYYIIGWIRKRYINQVIEKVIKWNRKNI
jgi:hypothetical protein